MLLIGHEHIQKIGDTYLSAVLIVVAFILLGIAIFDDNLFHKALVAGYVLLP